MVRFIIALIVPLTLFGQTYDRRDDRPLYTEFLDENFPFLEGTLDLRGIAPKGNTDNLIPRALLLPLEDDIYVCFDTELLRVACIWQGDFVTLDGIAILSYAVPLRKMGGGTEKLPKPIGKIVAATGLYPGWHKAGEERFEDPRSKWIDETELGRGPLPARYGQWIGVEDIGGSAILNYSLFGGKVREHFRVEKVENESVVVRSILLEGVDQKASLVIDDGGNGSPRIIQGTGGDSSGEALIVTYPISHDAEEKTEFTSFDFGVTKKEKHWPDSTSTEIEPGQPQGSYAVDHLRLPYPNPWQRRIRPYSIDFFPNGDAVIVTFDGDVYQLSGLGSHDNAVGWTKIAAGFHEPNCIKIRGEDIFVFSRMGITQLVDHDGDGETDFYKMFCNRFTQSGETRDFPMSLVLQKDGSFIISKGGQQVTSLSAHSGRVMHISADGKQVDYWAFGLRNGYLNSIPDKDLIVASDQQGNWVPTTPFHVIRKGSFLGYQPGAPFEDTPVQPAALWLPHRIAPSTIDPVWASDSRLGALQKSVLQLEYKLPAIIKIFIPEDGELTQTACVPLDLDLEVPLLKGAINPADGLPYMVGFQVWSCLAERLEGICRLRVIKETDQFPTRAQVFKEGVLLSFSNELDSETARDPANYQVNSWEYQRSEEYGSAQYKANGIPGADNRFVHSVLLSKDRKSVFIAIDQMTTTMQLEVQHALFDKWAPVYFTVNELPEVSLGKLGFEATNFLELFATIPTPRDESKRQSIISEARGQEVSTMYGCIGCHSIDGSTDGKTGPTWRGLYESRRVLADGSQIRATEDYLRESILDPSAVAAIDLLPGEAGMPPYKGILSEEDVESLILYIRSLK